ncbi:DNA translocase FtsK [Sinorhizobium sp. BG8]|uniref:DNA translocase FtsK n=1 Tax=Sinorhizobium sp. BG8 TaxID=2613773 RepID=UPI00193E3B57|nr:DNA translocase FtsK [Sinorhizobium sp. BG8]QRM57400.1 DNA translocase FtsK [Sinorhizobium sp. BG8]
MRISRNNFSSAALAHDGYEAVTPDNDSGDDGWDDATEAPAEEDLQWYDSHAEIANDAAKSRFRSPVLQGYDPAQNADGTWESHFYLAPNVRFTRTPDRVGAERRLAEQAEAIPQPKDPVPAQTLPSETALLQKLREALNERRRKPEPIVEPDAPAPLAVASTPEPTPQLEVKPIQAKPIQSVTIPVPQFARPVVNPPAAPAAPRQTNPEAATPSRFVNLSDFAFFETMAIDVDLIPERAPVRKDVAIAPAQKVNVAPAAPAPVSVPQPQVESIAHLFRVVECRKPSVAETPAADVSETAAVTPVVEIAAPAPSGPEAPALVAQQAGIAPVPAVHAANAVQPVVENVERPRVAVTSGVAISKPFQINLDAMPVASDPGYEFPPRDLLQEPPLSAGYVLSQETLEQNAGLLESVLEDFGVRGEIIHVRPGPVVTLYEFEPAPGVKSSRVIGLADDIARSMSALSARVAVVPGRNVIGIELPNATRETVYFREMIDSQDFARTAFKLPLCLGKTIGGEPVVAELAKMPHLLVAGTTGSGKSVAINTMILSLLYRFRPEECRLIMVDPKMLELSIYDGIPHLLTPVVTDPKKAVMALKWAVREMEDRYRKMSRLGVRNIDGYNSRAAAARAKGETIMATVQTGFDRGTGEAVHEQQEIDLDPMPYIVVIVDEMADLMMVAGKEIEGAIQRLAQMARAAGIHLIMATQRPSVDVITGTIKANFPTRISFQVTSKIDSRTILGEQGAEQLLGQGDMLHMAGGGRISRVHGPFVSDEEVEKVVLHLKAQGRPEYLETVTADEEESKESKEGKEVEPPAGAVFDKSDMAAEDGNDLYEKAVKVVMRDKKCSTSYIQRRLAIGYNRAASLVERMEKEGLVGPANHVGKREIINGERDAFGPIAPDEAE